MKLIHLADLHLGRRLGEYDLFEDQRHFLRQVVCLAGQRQADAVLVAGDIYDKAMPSAKAVTLLDGFLTDLAQAGIPLLAIGGNHDSAERLDYAGRLLASKGVYVAGSYRGSVPRVVLRDAYGEADFWLLPFIRASAAAYWHPEQDCSTYDKALGAVLDACPVDPARRNVLLAHQLVLGRRGEEPEKGGSESVSVIGTLENVSLGRFDAFDYVALGHIHRPQAVGRPGVRYAGSPLAYSTSETEQKSIPLVTLGPKGSVEVELIPIVPLRRLRRIEGPLARLTACAADPEDYIVARLTDPGAVPDAMGRLRAVYPNLVRLELPDSAPQDGAGAAALEEGKSVRQLFEEFYAAVHGEAPDKQMLALFDDALQNAPSESEKEAL